MNMITRPIPEGLQNLGLSKQDLADRKNFIGGSDANIIMGSDHEAIDKLIRQKRGDIPLENLTRILQVMLGIYTEPFNRLWFTLLTGREVAIVERIPHPTIPYIAASLDGETTSESGEPAVFEAKHTSERSSMEDLVRWYYPQLQNNMEVRGFNKAILSAIFGNSKFNHIEVEYDAPYIEVMHRRFATFWDCVKAPSSRDARWPGLPDEEVPDPEMPARIKAARPIDMRADERWMRLADRYVQVAGAAEQARVIEGEIKEAVRGGLLPPDFKIGFGGGLCVRQNANRAITVCVDKEPRPAPKATPASGATDFSSLDAAIASMED